MSFKTYIRCLNTSTFLSLFLLSGVTVAQQSSGMQFLNIGPSAQSLGMSETHTAVALGASSIYTNPALLTRDAQSSGILSYMSWSAVDTQNSHAAVNLKRNNDAFGFGIISSIVDDIQQRDGPGQPSGNISVHYLSIAGAYSIGLGPVSFGITGMYLYEQLFHQNASGLAISAGAATYMLDNRVRLGATLLNYGRMQELVLEATELPTTFRTGADIQVLQFSASGTEDIPLLFIISSDFVKPLNDHTSGDEENRDIVRQDEAYFNLALRVEISDILILRSGYKTNHPNRNMSFGAGIRINNINFDYAFAPFDTGFGAAHGISIAYYF